MQGVCTMERMTEKQEFGGAWMEATGNGAGNGAGAKL